VNIPSYNGSLIYKSSPTPRSISPTTTARTPPAPSATAGGITGWNAAGTGLDKENFTQPSELDELGTKFAAHAEQGVPQLRGLRPDAHGQEHEFDGHLDLQISGLRGRAELPAQQTPLTPRLSTPSIDAEQSAPFQYGLFGGASELPPGNRTNSTVAIGSKVKVSGLPSNLFNGLIFYTFDNGFGFSANTVVTGEMNNNAAGSLKDPAPIHLRSRRLRPLRQRNGNSAPRC